MDSFTETENAPTEEEDINVTLDRLRIVAPLKMRRLERVSKQREKYVKALDDKDTYRTTSDNVRLIYELGSTEGSMIEDILNGATEINPLTAQLWSKVLMASARRVDFTRRWQIFEELQDASQIPGIRERVGRLLEQYNSVFPEVKDGLQDEALNRQQLDLEHQSQKMFTNDLGQLFIK
jgi:hypothetical protein